MTRLIDRLKIKHGRKLSEEDVAMAKSGSFVSSHPSGFPKLVVKGDTIVKMEKDYRDDGDASWPATPAVPNFYESYYTLDGLLVKKVERLSFSSNDRGEGILKTIVYSHPGSFIGRRIN